MTANDRAAPTYLLDVEASHITCEALPGAVVVSLKRDLPADRKRGRRPRRMMIELCVSEAFQHYQALGRVLQQAGALGSATPGVDAAAPL